MKLSISRLKDWLKFESLSASETNQKKLAIESVFSGREILSDEQFCQRYFQQYEVSANTVAKIRRIFSEILKADLSRIQDMDDFSKNLAFFWNFDSMAAVDLVVALEKEFEIEISDSEATAMTTMKDIVLTVHNKIVAKKV